MGVSKKTIPTGSPFWTPMRIGTFRLYGRQATRLLSSLRLMKSLLLGSADLLWLRGPGRLAKPATDAIMSRGVMLICTFPGWDNDALRIKS